MFYVLREVGFLGRTGVVTDFSVALAEHVL